jgi:hypothetical protein
MNASDCRAISAFLSCMSETIFTSPTLAPDIWKITFGVPLGQWMKWAIVAGTSFSDSSYHHPRKFKHVWTVALPHQLSLYVWHRNFPPTAYFSLSTLKLWCPHGKWNTIITSTERQSFISPSCTAQKSKLTVHFSMAISRKPTACNFIPIIIL